MQLRTPNQAKLEWSSAVAARNKTRGVRLVGRVNENRSPGELSNQTAMRKAFDERPSTVDHVVRDLQLIALRLEVIHRTALTVEAALRHQNAENGTDFADCIRHGVCNPLADQSKTAQILVGRIRGGVGSQKKASTSKRVGGSGKERRR